MSIIPNTLISQRNVNYVINFILPRLSNIIKYYQQTLRSMITENRLKLDTRQCRICLQNQSECKKQIVAPCSCTGSVEHVHTVCMEKWIETCVKKNSKKCKQSDMFIECEMCKQPIYYELKRIIKLNSCEQLIQSIKQNKYLNLTLFLILLFVLISLGVITWFIIGSRINFQGENIYESILFVVLSAFILFFCLVSPISIVILYFLHLEYRCALTRIIKETATSQIEETPSKL